MTFKLSKTSLGRLEGVDERLVECVKLALTKSTVDFGVASGMRTAEEQNELFKAGLSKCDGYEKLSYHQSGKAVDFYGWVQGRSVWEMRYYDDIAEAMRLAAHELGIDGMRWGGAWHVGCICEFYGTMEQAHLEYIDLRRSQGRRPFIDGPHFEIGD